MKEEKTLKENIEFLIMMLKREKIHYEKEKQYDTEEFVDSLIDDLEYAIQISKK